MRALLVLVIAAALLGSTSGGSASALTTPAWLAMGVPLPTAVATDKLAGALWTLLGARNYLAGRRRHTDIARKHRSSPWRVNAHGGFGVLSRDVAFEMAQIHDILARHAS